MQTLWREDGTKWWTTLWKLDDRHAVETAWNDDGLKLSEIMWRDGEQHGVSTWWYESGGKWGEAHFFFGEEYARIEWNEKGTMAKVKFPPRDPIKTSPNPKDQSTKITLRDE